jgi:predicted PurR-regulated permease PerM
MPTWRTRYEIDHSAKLSEPRRSKWTESCLSHGFTRCDDRSPQIHGNRLAPFRIPIDSGRSDSSERSLQTWTAEDMDAHREEELFIRKALFVALLLAGGAALWYLGPLLLLVFGAILVAIVLLTLARPIVAIGLSERASVALVLVFAIAIAAAFGLTFGAELASQSAGLNEQFSRGLRQWIGALNLQNFDEFLQGIDLAAVVPRFLSWGVTLGQAILGAVLVIVGGIYIALNPRPYRDGLLKLVPKQSQPHADATVEDISEALEHWLRGMLAAMVIIGALTAFGLWIAGVQSPFLLGTLSGLANFVPYIGSIAAAVLTLTVAAAQGWDTILWAAAVMFIVQQIESNVVSPLVVGGAVNILPATGLFAVVAMAMLFGPLGVLFAFPLTIVADIAIRRLYVRDTLDKPVEILGEAAAPSEVEAHRPN